MNFLFIIILVLAILTSLFILFNKQLFNRKCFIQTKNKIENYTLNNVDQTDNLEKILNEYNLTRNAINITTIDKQYTYSKGNLDRVIYDRNKCIIENCINSINKKSNISLKLYEIERIEELFDSLGNKQYLSYIFIDLNKATHYLVFSHTISKNNNVNINYLKRVVDSMVSKNTQLNELASHYNQNNVSRNRYISKNLYGVDKYNPHILKNLPSNLSKLAKLSKANNNNIIQEPCKYNLHEWDTRGVNTQAKLINSCKIGNNSDTVAAVHLYNNPTVLGLTTENITI